MLFKAVMLLITFGLITFAFAHSSMPADVSTEESESVTLFLQKILQALGFAAELTDHIVRKSAHFAEFSAIGAMLLSSAYAFNKSRPQKYYFQVLFVGLMTAVIDEAIQLNVVGRSGQITDVLLDFSGVLVGSIFMLIAFAIYRRVRKIK